MPRDLPLSAAATAPAVEASPVAPPDGAGSTSPRLLALPFFLSGAASLVVQVVWLRYLGLVFGNTTHAAATLLAVFLGGLGGGALLFGRRAERLRHPLRVYALLEVGVALAALLSPALLDAISRGYVGVYRGIADEPALFALTRVVLAAACLLPPTLLMGGTLPVMLRAVTRAASGRQATAVLYGANTLGAVAGTWLAGFVTVRLIGLRGTLAVAAALSLTAALIAILSTARRPAPAPSAPPAAAASVPTVGRGLLLLFALMGATSLACEVLWTRILVFYLGSSVYAYSLMLLLFLLGIALGSLAVGVVARRAAPLPTLAVLELLLALWALAQIPLFGRLNELLGFFATLLAPRGFAGIAMVQVLAVGAVLLLPTFLMGLSFPLAVDALGGRRTSRDAGMVYGANTLGSVGGALAAGFFAIPMLGTQRSLLLAGGVNLLLAALFAARARPAARRILLPFALVAPFGWVLLDGVFAPDQVILAAGIFRDDEPGALVYFHEDASASVTIRRLQSPLGPYLSLELNGVNVAGTSPDLYAIQKMQGHLPMLLGRTPRHVVHIGFGSGGTANAVSRHPVDEILVVEISPAVIAASDRYFRDINHGVLEDPRVQVEINDGRNFLLASPRHFDAVLSDSIHPRYAGNGSLYTREYFRLLRARLAPGGVASMWLPMYSLTPRNFAMILAAFRESFPNFAVWYEPTALNSFTVVTGKVEPETWSAESLHRAFGDPRVGGELADLGIHGPAEVLACYLGGPRELGEWLDSVPSHSDDLPAVEYESGMLLDFASPWLATFDRLLAGRPTLPPREYLTPLPLVEQERATRQYVERRSLLDLHRRALASQLEQAAK